MPAAGGAASGTALASAAAASPSLGPPSSFRRASPTQRAHSSAPATLWAAAIAKTSAQEPVWCSTAPKAGTASRPAIVPAVFCVVYCVYMFGDRQAVGYLDCAHAARSRHQQSRWTPFQLSSKQTSRRLPRPDPASTHPDAKDDARVARRNVEVARAHAAGGQGRHALQSMSVCLR